MKSTLSLFAGFGLTMFLLYFSVQPVYAGSIVVTTTSDANADDGLCSLREALIAANINGTFRDCVYSGAPGADIIDMTGITGTLTLTDTLPFISESVEIRGPGRDNLRIDGGDLYSAFLSTLDPITMTVDALSLINMIGPGVGVTLDISVTNSMIDAGDCGVISLDGSAYVSDSKIISRDCDGVAAANSVIVYTSVISAAVDGVYADTGNAQVIRSTITAGEDGVDADAGSAEVISSTIRADVDGVYADAGSAQVISSTITAGEDGVDANIDVIVTNSMITATVDGVFTVNGSATVVDTTIVASQFNGIAAFSGATVMSSTITSTNNGVLVGDGDVTVMNSVINSLGDDGVDADAGNILVDRSRIFANESALDADAGNIEVRNSQIIGNEDGINVIGTATVISSTVTGNTLAGVDSSVSATISYSLIANGGGDGVIAPSVTIFQSTISGNGGDGVQSSNQTTISVTQSTIANNVGYGINNATGANDVINSIVAENGGLLSTRDVNGAVTGRYNLIGNGDGAGLTDGIDGNLVGSTGSLFDPQIDLLTNQGSYTDTHALLPNSPAIDHIPSNLCAAAVDQRGEPRPKGSGCDIGAYEAGSGRITIVKTASPADGTDFTFSTTAFPSGSFTLDDAAVDDMDGFTNTQQLNGLEPGLYTFTETVPALWALTAIDCDRGSVVVDLSSGSVQIDLAEDDAVVCTFSNAERPDLQLAKTDDDVTVSAGDTLTYTLTYTNAGGATAGVVLTETLPLSTTLDVSASTTGWNCQPDGTCLLAIGALAKNETGTALFVVTVDAELSESVLRLENTAVIGDDGSSGVDLNPADNQATETTFIVDRPGYRLYLPLVLAQP